MYVGLPVVACPTQMGHSSQIGRAVAHGSPSELKNTPRAVPSSRAELRSLANGVSADLHRLPDPVVTAGIGHGGIDEYLPRLRLVGQFGGP